MHKARTLKELRQVCKGSPLKGEELDSFFVETDRGRDPMQETRNRVRLALEEGENRRLLFCGHRGCGKSTELNMLIREMGDAVLPVIFSAIDQMQATTVCAEDLLLVICEQALKTAHENGVKVNQDILKGVHSYFETAVVTSRESSDVNLAVGAGVTASAPVIGPLLKLLGSLTADIKIGTYHEKSAVRELRKRPAELLMQINLALKAISSALGRQSKLLVIVEDLDKLDFERAHPLFVRNVNLLSGVETNIIYTVPVWLFHSPDAEAFSGKFDLSLTLPMIKVYDPAFPDKQAEGFSVVKEVVLRRIEPGLIEDEALNHAILQTGGVLRHLFETLYTASTAKGAVAPLGRKFIEYGLNRLTRDLRLQITLPRERIPGGPESVDALYKRLAEYAAEQKKGKRPPCVSDPVNQILLKSCALVEYNGEGWFGVHPLVVEILQRIDAG